MPQNDIKLMHNFTTHLSRHALTHRGAKSRVFTYVCVCVCNMCVVSLFWGEDTGSAHLRSRQTYVNSTQRNPLTFACFSLYSTAGEKQGQRGSGRGVTGSRSVGFCLFYGIL